MAIGCPIHQVRSLLDGGGLGWPLDHATSPSARRRRGPSTDEERSDEERSDEEIDGEMTAADSPAPIVPRPPPLDVSSGAEEDHEEDAATLLAARIASDPDAFAMPFDVSSLLSFLLSLTWAFD